MSSDVKSHYNSQANQHGSRDDALKSRRQGGAYPLKAFHNSVKRYLISQLAGGSDCHLDIACGRGGDLDKWRSAGIKRVLGIDLSPNEIKEARIRYREMATSSRGRGGGGRGGGGGGGGGRGRGGGGDDNFKRRRTAGGGAGADGNDDGGADDGENAAAEQRLRSTFDVQFDARDDCGTARIDWVSLYNSRFQSPLIASSSSSSSSSSTSSTSSSSSSSASSSSSSSSSASLPPTKCILSEKPMFTSASCMFALHYFFNTEGALQTVLANVVSSLQQGAHFFGVIPDGKIIATMLGPNAEYRSRFLRLVKQWSGQPQCFGSGYMFALRDTVTSTSVGGGSSGGGGEQGQESKEAGGDGGGEGEGDDIIGATEYLVFYKVFASVAAQFHLFPVKAYGETATNATQDKFAGGGGRMGPGAGAGAGAGGATDSSSSSSSMFHIADRECYFKHLNPSFPQAEDGGSGREALEEASRLYAGFVFQFRPRDPCPQFCRIESHRQLQQQQQQQQQPQQSSSSSSTSAVSGEKRSS